MLVSHDGRCLGEGFVFRVWCAPLPFFLWDGGDIVLGGGFPFSWCLLVFFVFFVCSSIFFIKVPSNIKMDKYYETEEVSVT